MKLDTPEIEAILRRIADRLARLPAAPETAEAVLSCGQRKTAARARPPFFVYEASGRGEGGWGVGVARMFRLAGRSVRSFGAALNGVCP